MGVGLSMHTGAGRLPVLHVVVCGGTVRVPGTARLKKAHKVVGQLESTEAARSRTER
jgi:hypothetical protein